MVRKIIDKIYKLTNESKRYQKFVIIARSRTGSNLLRSYLNSHPQIEAHDELFGELKGKTCKEIWDALFIHKNKKTKYVGFKIFYYHPLEGVDNAVWDFIKKDKSIKIIHLKRENMLRAYLSRLIALKTNRWIEEGKNERITLENRRQKIDIDDCMKVFQKVKRWEKETIENFSTHPFFETTYEDLTRNSQLVMTNIFSFFQLKPYPISTNLKKQNSESIEDLVINYDEVQKRLTQAGYAEYFVKEHEVFLK